MFLCYITKDRFSTIGRKFHLQFIIIINLALSIYTINFLPVFLGTLKPADVPITWIDMVDPCTKIMESQVKTEIEAAMTYLAMVCRF